MQVGSDGQACASCHFHAGRAPFDHPSLDLPNGGKIAIAYLREFGEGAAMVLDDRVLLPAIGAAGCQPDCGDGLGSPGTPFANFLQPLTP